MVTVVSYCYSRTLLSISIHALFFFFIYQNSLETIVTIVTYGI